MHLYDNLVVFRAFLCIAIKTWGITSALSERLLSVFVRLYENLGIFVRLFCRGVIWVVSMKTWASLRRF